MLSKQLGFITVEVVEVFDDCRLKVKKPFPTKGIEALREEGNKLREGNDSESAGFPFKVLPYVDQVS